MISARLSKTANTHGIKHGDARLKTEQLLLLALALALPLASAHAVLITTNTTIAVGNTTYDGQEIVVSNCTLTVNGPHSFTSLLVTSNGVVTHTGDPAGTLGNRLELTILNDATVSFGSVLQADGRGYGAQQGPGAGGAGATSRWVGSGAGHGGLGGQGDRGSSTTVEGGVSYGSVLEPTTQGSGGGYSGGTGGGVIRLTVAGTLTVEGQLRANGVPPGSGTGGGGAGGSLWLTVGTLSGAGVISADGGASFSVYGGGGAGGRIALYHTDNLFAGTLSAQGGAGYQLGGAGTIYTKATSQPVGDVLVYNLGTNGAMTPLTALAPFSLTVTGWTTVFPQSALLLGNLRLASHATLTQSNVDLTVLHDLAIEPGAAIRTDGLGGGPGTGGAAAGSRYAGSGAGHGGLGGRGDCGSGVTVAGGVSYGSMLEPTTQGSGGGYSGGAGGGLIRLTVAGTLTVEGQLRANGVSPGSGASTANSGGGSGGSLWLTVGTLAGTGGLMANGGASFSAYGGGGAGGRIALYHTNNSFTGTLSAQGGTGYQTGGAGTIYTKAASQPVGDVLISSLGTNAAMTPLTAPEPFRATVAGWATVFPQTALVLGNLRLATNATLTHLLAQSNVELTVLYDLTIEPGAVIRTDGLGNDPGPGAGGQAVSTRYAGGGAGHGSVGGFGDVGSGRTAAGGLAYGLAQQPTDKGSRGGYSGGMGGGAIRLNVGGTLTVDGQISAAGNPATANNAGGGSGGSIWVTSGILTGTGSLSAIGGNGHVYGGGGAGGRIAVCAANTTGYGNVTNHVALHGGSGAQGGGSGTLYLALHGIGFTPADTVSYAVSNVDVFFNVAANPATVTTDDVTITTPGGPIPPSQITVEMLGGTQLRLGFPPQNLPGSYQVQVGPQIEDLFGNAMPQPYGAAFTIAAPLIAGTVHDTDGLPVAGVTLQPGGGLSGALTATDGQYSLPVLASWTGTVTPAKPGWTFVPGSRSYTDLSANVTNQHYVLVETIASAIWSRQQGTNCHVEWYGLSGVGYQPQSSTNLVNWADYGSLRNGTNGPLWFNVPITSAPRMFFRIRSDN